jgi:predicted acyltransferase
MGILQRIALCYGVLSLLHAATNYGQKSYRFIGVLLTSAFVMIYLTFMLTFDKPEEGCPKENNLEEFCNFGAYWDRKMFTESHMIYPSDP